MSAIDSTMAPPFGKIGESGKHAAPLIVRRQLCFFLLFVLPVSKLLEAPSLLAYFSKGDLLIPAFSHYLLQTGVLIAMLCVCARSDEPILTRLFAFSKPLGRILCAAFAVYFVFSDLFPLLDMERFADTVFFDTAPSVSAFLPFFLLSAFICVKDEKAIGRSADLCMPIFLFSFLGLIFMAMGETDFTELFPLFGTSAKANFKGFYHSFVHFSDAAAILPLLCAYRYEKGDGKKIAAAYAGGGGFVMLFLAVFYGVFGALAPRETYAFDKIARYFSALDVVGRVDLLLVYAITIVSLYAYALPLQLSVICLCSAFGAKGKKRTIYSICINGAMTLFVIFCVRFYHVFYSFFTAKAFFVFPVFSVILPLCLLFLPNTTGNGKKRKKRKEAAEADKEAENNGQQATARGKNTEAEAQ